MPSIENVATAYGLCYIEVDDRKAMKAQIAKALQTPGPVVIGIRAQANQIIIPTVASVQLPNGSMRSNPLQRMSPDLPADVFAAEFEGALPSAQTLKNA
jgi:acetolactate synthase-1/2/3 large subunit